MSDTPATAAFPLAPPPFAGNSRVVPASSAFDWLQFGWLMFIAEAGIWVGAAVLLLVCLLLVNFVPFIGMAAAHFLLPVFTGGLMLGCREIENGGKLHLRDLFHGFHPQSREVINVGALYMVLWLGVVGIGVLFASVSVMSGLFSASPAGFGIAIGGALLAALLTATLAMPLLMAVWFAPALTQLHGMKAIPAMKASFTACARNWLAMTVFGIMVVLLVFFALLPVGLGFLVLLPVLFGAMYAAHRDIFIGA